MKNFIRILLTPSIWLRNYPTDLTWDLILRKAMSTHKFKGVNEYEAQLGDLTIWIENHPYCSFHPSCGPRVLPTRATAFEAYDKYLTDTLGTNGGAQ